MSSFVELQATDGHLFQAWLATPAGTPRGAVIVAPEIVGVNGPIRAVADGYAADDDLANYGFNCDQRGSWDAPSAVLARERTLAFLAEHLG